MKMLLLFWTLTCAASVGAQTPGLESQPPSQKPKSVHQLFVEDQEDIPGAANGMSKVTEEEYNEHVKAREATLRAMLAAGEIKTGDDFKDAAYIFQHGDNLDDCLFAHVLAMEAILHGNESAKWIAAATLDRYLQTIKQPQIFGTQYPLDPKVAHSVEGGNAPFLSGRTLEPYNENLLPDSARLDFCVPKLEQQKENVTSFNSGKRPRGTMVAPGCSR